MDFLTWLDAHTVGWPVFLPAMALFGIAATHLARTGRTPLIPWLSLGTWLAICCVVYVISHVHHLVFYARRLWAANMIVLTLCSAIPIGIALVMVFAPPLRTLRWHVHAAAVAASGVAAIPLTNMASGWLGQHVLASWFQQVR